MSASGTRTCPAGGSRTCAGARSSPGEPAPPPRELSPTGRRHAARMAPLPLWLSTRRHCRLPTPPLCVPAPQAGLRQPAALRVHRDCGHPGDGAGQAPHHALPRLGCSHLVPGKSTVFACLLTHSRSPAPLAAAHDAPPVLPAGRGGEGGGGALRCACSRRLAGCTPRLPLCCAQWPTAAAACPSPSHHTARRSTLRWTPSPHGSVSKRCAAPRWQSCARIACRRPSVSPCWRAASRSATQPAGDASPTHVCACPLPLPPMRSRLHAARDVCSDRHPRRVHHLSPPARERDRRRVLRNLLLLRRHPGAPRTLRTLCMLRCAALP